MTAELLRQIAEKVLALNILKRESGFSTNRTVVALLSPLEPQDLTEVATIIAAMSVKKENQ
ncbi:MAG: hypothetical protein ACRD3P_09060 [Terriglobales bacterium]